MVNDEPGLQAVCEVAAQPADLPAVCTGLGCAEGMGSDVLSDPILKIWNEGKFIMYSNSSPFSKLAQLRSLHCIGMLSLCHLTSVTLVLILSAWLENLLSISM